MLRLNEALEEFLVRCEDGDIIARCPREAYDRVCSAHQNLSPRAQATLERSVYAACGVKERTP